MCLNHYSIGVMMHFSLNHKHILFMKILILDMVYLGRSFIWLYVVHCILFTMHINKIIFKILSQIHFFSWGCLLFWVFSFIAVMYGKDSHIPRWQESSVFKLEFLCIQILHLNVNTSGIKSTCIRTYRNDLIFFKYLL